MAVAFAEDGKLDIGLVREPGRPGLRGIIAPEIMCSHRIGFGEAITERGLRAWKLLLQALDMTDRTRRTARGDVGQRREVIFVALRMSHELVTHRRHPNEVSDLLLFDQP